MQIESDDKCDNVSVILGVIQGYKNMVFKYDRDVLSYEKRSGTLGIP